MDAPALPEPMFPERTVWVAALERAIEAAIVRGIPASKIVLVGHSLGCLTILLALERHEGEPFSNVLLVSGFGRNFGAFGLGPWVRKPVDFQIVRPQSRAWHVLHGKSDVLVPFAEGRWLAKQLHASFIETGWPGHFMHEEGVKELPEALDVLLETRSA